MSPSPTDLNASSGSDAYAYVRDSEARLRREQEKSLDRLESTLKDLRTELKTDMKDLKTELKTDIKDLGTKLETKFTTDMKDLKTELKTDIKDLKTLGVQGILTLLFFSISSQPDLRNFVSSLFSFVRS